MDSLSRRAFMKLSALAASLPVIGHLNVQGRVAPPQQGTRPLVISSANGLQACAKAMTMLKAGADTLDAVIAGVNIVELDPEDTSVGYGGLPNEDGVVELDASVFHGPTKRAGAVAAIQGIKTPSLVAKKVMEETDHVLIVGEGALRFAEAMGFQRENLLTEKSRYIWLKWKEARKDSFWGPGLADPKTNKDTASLDPRHREWNELAREWIAHPPTGTINCTCVDASGNISGVTTTSGLAWKIPGRVGDSPIIGDGLFVDNNVGAAGSTGRGEENLKTNASRIIVENMSRGMSPTDACIDALKRISANYNHNKEKLSQFYVNFYALNKQGQYGGAGLWSHYARTDGSKTRVKYAVNDGGDSRLVDAAYLYER